MSSIMRAMEDGMDENVVTMTNPNKKIIHMHPKDARETSDVKKRHVRLVMDRVGALRMKRHGRRHGYASCRNSSAQMIN
jgi:hypothetical protein